MYAPTGYETVRLTRALGIIGWVFAFRYLSKAETRRANLAVCVLSGG